MMDECDRKILTYLRCLWPSSGTKKGPLGWYVSVCHGLPLSLGGSAVGMSDEAMDVLAPPDYMTARKYGILEGHTSSFDVNDRRPISVFSVPGPIVSVMAEMGTPHLMMGQYERFVFDRCPRAEAMSILLQAMGQSPKKLIGGSE